MGHFAWKSNCWLVTLWFFLLPFNKNLVHACIIKHNTGLQKGTYLCNVLIYKTTTRGWWKILKIWFQSLVSSRQKDNCSCGKKLAVLNVLLCSRVCANEKNGRFKSNPVAGDVGTFLAVFVATKLGGFTQRHSKMFYTITWCKQVFFVH